METDFYGSNEKSSLGTNQNAIDQIENEITTYSICNLPLWGIPNLKSNHE